MSEDITPKEIIAKPYANQDIIDYNKRSAYEFMNPERWALMKQVANTFVESGAVPAGIKNGHQMAMVMQAGYEAGLQPIEAMNSFYFVNGKISLYGEVAIALVRRAGHTIEWGTCNDVTATCKITRCDTKESLEQTFTMQMAINRKLTSKGGAWISAPDNMLKFKAFWAVARFLVPDALHGVPGKEELEYVVEGEVVEDKKDIGSRKYPTTVATHGEVSKKSLADALEEPEEVEEKPKKPAKKKEVEAEPVAEETIDKPVPKEVEGVSDEVQEKPVESASKRRMREAMEQTKNEREKYNSLCDKELNGETLTTEEVKFCNEYNTKH